MRVRSHRRSPAMSNCRGLSDVVSGIRSGRTQIQHRRHAHAHAHAMLAGTSVKPPQLDEFFCEGEAHLRAQDFAELGWTEEEVWG